MNMLSITLPDGSVREVPPGSTPMDIAAAIVRVPTRCRTPFELVVFANCITLTPGTITLEADEAARVLYVHGMFVADRAEFRARLADMERRVLGAVRPRIDRGEVGV